MVQEEVAEKWVYMGITIWTHIQQTLFHPLWKECANRRLSQEEPMVSK